MTYRKATACILAVAALVAVPLACRKSKPAGLGTVPIVIETSKGVIKVDLDGDRAPISTANFLRYVDEGFYDGTIFHRVIPDFMIQGGGFRPDMSEKPTHAPIKNEAGNGLKNRRGAIAMARTGVVDSATAQFYINVVDNTGLDHRDQSKEGYGYAVFGKVTEGMDVVDAIDAVPTHSVGGMKDVPVEAVKIISIRRAPLAMMPATAPTTRGG